MFASWLSIWMNIREYVWPECTKAKFNVFMAEIFVWMPALWFYNTSTFGVSAGQSLSSKKRFILVQLTLLYVIFFRVLFMSVVQFPHMIILGFWSTFIPVKWRPRIAPQVWLPVIKPWLHFPRIICVGLELLWRNILQVNTCASDQNKRKFRRWMYLLPPVTQGIRF